jgi:NADPH:quinone reductase-like Zn-dependent oxidoreductase
MTIRIPQQMRAAAIDGFGKPEVLTIHTLPVPELDSGEVLIAVHTAGVGGWDADMRGGWWPEGRPKFPVVLGTDGSGRVAAVGPRVRRLAVGDKVYAYSFNNPKGGFYAEYVAVPADNAARVPEVLDLKHAGAIGTTGLTALQGVEDALRIRAGDVLIIHGASGGVGTLAVQFARMRGARVFATASGEDGVNLVRRLGADEAINGLSENLTAAVRAFAPGGVDAVLAFVGGERLNECLDAVRPGGKIAYPNGVEPRPRKRKGIDVIAYDAVPGAAEFRRLNRAVEKASLKVPIAAVYKLEEASEAHKRLAEGHVLGKIVLRIR